MKNIPFYVPEVCDGHYCPMDCEAHCPWADEAIDFIAEQEAGETDDTELDFAEIDITDTPYAEWLEKSIKTIMTLQPDTIGLVAIRNADEMCMTAYYNADAHDMGRFISNIQSDFVMEVIEANAKTIRDIVMEADGETEEEDYEDQT